MVLLQTFCNNVVIKFFSECLLGSYMCISYGLKIVIAPFHFMDNKQFSFMNTNQVHPISLLPMLV